MIAIIVWILGIVGVYGQINREIMDPLLQQVRLSTEFKTVSTNQRLKMVYEYMGFEIEGKVLETSNDLTEEQRYNESFYSNSSSCRMYGSQLGLQTLEDVSLVDWQIETSYVSQQRKSVYLLESNDNYGQDIKLKKTIHTYKYDAYGLAHQNKTIDLAQIGLNVSEGNDMLMLEYNDVLIVTDGVVLVAVDLNTSNNFWKITIAGVPYSNSYINNRDSQLLKFQLCHSNSNSTRFMLFWSTKIQMFTLSQDKKVATFMEQKTPPAGKIFIDLIADSSVYYGLVEKALLIYRPNKSEVYEMFTIQLQSKECLQLSKFQTTLHILCRQSGINYVAQFYFDDEFIDPSKALILNRYYTDIQDAKLILSFGIDEDLKLLINGDNNLQLSSYGVNRKVLLQMKSSPKVIKLKALGIEDIVTIQEYSDYSATYAFGIATDYITYFKITQNPPEVECTLNKQPGKKVNILVVFNTSSCWQAGYLEQLNAICHYLIPYTFSVPLIEFQSSRELTITIVVFAVIAVVFLILMGCGFKWRGLREKTIAVLRKKIEKLKAKGSKPI